jgi:hypothetical protein
MDRYIIHLINYDHSKLFDSINPKNDISIQFSKPDFDIGEIYIISPDFEGNTILEFGIYNESVEVIVPYLEVYNVLIISK